MLKAAVRTSITLFLSFLSFPAFAIDSDKGPHEYLGRWGGTAVRALEVSSLPRENWRTEACEDFEIWINAETSGGRLTALTIARSLICKGRQRVHFPYYRFTVSPEGELLYTYRRSGRVVSAGIIGTSSLNIRIPTTDGFHSFEISITADRLAYLERDLDEGRGPLIQAELERRPAQPPKETSPDL